jgi:hypothetical protein
MADDVRKAFSAESFEAKLLIGLQSSGNFSSASEYAETQSSESKNAKQIVVLSILRSFRCDLE